MKPRYATRLAELMAGPSLADIAREAECSPSYVSAVANGRKRPSDRVKLAAALVLKLPIEAIFPDEEATE